MTADQHDEIKNEAEEAAGLCSVVDAEAPSEAVVESTQPSEPAVMLPLEEVTLRREAQNDLGMEYARSMRFQELLAEEERANAALLARRARFSSFAPRITGKVASVGALSLVCLVVGAMGFPFGEPFGEGKQPHTVEIALQESSARLDLERLKQEETLPESASNREAKAAFVKLDEATTVVEPAADQEFYEAALQNAPVADELPKDLSLAAGQVKEVTTAPAAPVGPSELDSSDMAAMHEPIVDQSAAMKAPGVQAELVAAATNEGSLVLPLAVAQKAEAGDKPKQPIIEDLPKSEVALPPTPSGAVVKESSSPARGWYLQLSAERESSSAYALATRAVEFGGSTTVQPISVNGANFYRVLVGPVNSRASAQGKAAGLKQKLALKETPFVREIK